MRWNLLLIVLGVLFLILGPMYCGDIQTDADELNEGIKRICQEQSDNEKRALEYVNSIRAIAEKVDDVEIYEELMQTADDIEYSLTEYNYEESLLDLVKEVDP